MRRVLSLLLVSLCFSIIAVVVPVAQAQVPSRLSYQGLLTTPQGQPITDGSYRVTFRLYADADDGQSAEALFEETQTVAVAGGLFSTLIGKEALLDLPFDQAYFLTVEVEGQSESEKVPLATSPYALNVADGAVVRSLSGLRDEVEIVAGEGIAIEQRDNQLVISAPVGLRAAGGAAVALATCAGDPGCTLHQAYLNGPTITVGGPPAVQILGTGNNIVLRVQDGQILQTANGANAAMRFQVTGGAVGTQTWQFRNILNTGQFQIQNTTDGRTPLVVDKSAVEGLVRLSGSEVQVKGSLSRVDGSPLEVRVGGARVMRYDPQTATEGPNVIGGYAGNSVGASVEGATISGGGDPDNGGVPAPNQVTGDYGTVGGGYTNTASGSSATVGGGSSNEASGFASTMGGGFLNMASGNQSTVAGGGENTASDTYATVGGGQDNTASDTYATVSGGGTNTASGSSATVAGGIGNTASASFATVGGGEGNTASGQHATVGGGEGNTAIGTNATVGGGEGNTASGQHATVGGGEGNTAIGTNATVGGGWDNEAIASYATVGGGYTNTASGFYATVTGGRSNQAGGDYSFAAGRRAKVRDAAASGDSDGDEGTFLWADSEDADFVSTGPDQFLVRASGGVGLGTNTPVAPLDLQSQDNWNPATTEGDFRIGNDTHRLVFGVALTGGGAGHARIHTKSSSSNRLYLGNDGTDVAVIQSTVGLYPAADNTFNLGQSGQRWTEVWSVNGSINTSDRRAKEEIEGLDYGLEAVLRLRAVSYRWKDRPGGQRRLGLIAQEVAEVVPEVVRRPASAGALFGLSYGELVPVLIRAVQQQQAEITQQQAEIEALRAQVAAVDQVQAEMARQQTEMARQQAEMAALRALVEAAVGAGAGPASSPTGETGTTAPQD